MCKNDYMILTGAPEKRGRQSKKGSDDFIGCRINAKNKRSHDFPGTPYVQQNRTILTKNPVKRPTMQKRSDNFTGIHCVQKTWTKK